jgi:hypothetical protein
MTKKTTGAKTKASVAKYNNDLQKLWETELYNNPDFGAACFGIVTDNEGNLYVSGKTEVTKTEGTLDNSFMASLSTSGSVNWKKYLENSNSGSSIIINDSGNLTMLNKNCFIINLAEPVHGDDAGRIRMFSVCNPYNTDAFGTDLDICPNGNILLAGSLGENFYLALKSSP